MKKPLKKIIFLNLVMLLSLTGFAQKTFQTAEANFIHKLVTTKGAAYFDKNFESEFKKQGYTLDDDMIFINVGEALLEEKKNEEAISVLKFGAQKFPKIKMLWNGLGEAYLEKGNKTEAKKCFETVLKMMPDNERAKEGLKKTND